jgi:hypothetical protein
MPPVSDAPPQLTALRACALADRDLYERSQRAYVSIIRGYREHLCDFIFKLELFDYAGLACALGLLQLPYMRELIRAGAKPRNGMLVLEGFVADPTDVKMLTFADPVDLQLRCNKPSTLSPQNSTLNPQPSTVNRQPSTLDPEPCNNVQVCKAAQAQNPNLNPNLNVGARGRAAGEACGGGAGAR